MFCLGVRAAAKLSRGGTLAASHSCTACTSILHPDGNDCCRDHCILSDQLIITYKYRSTPPSQKTGSQVNGGPLNSTTAQGSLQKPSKPMYPEKIKYGKQSKQTYLVMSIGKAYCFPHIGMKKTHCSFDIQSETGAKALNIGMFEGCM